MAPSKIDDPEAVERKTTLLKRKMAQADEGRIAMADYHRLNQATLDRTSKLKAMRLAKEVQEVKVEAVKPKRARKKTTT